MRSGEPIRLAFCVDTLDVGGTELNAVRTAERLDPARFRLSLFHIHQDGPLLPRYRDICADVVHVPVERLASFRTAGRGLWLASHLRRLRIDIFHAHDVYSNILGVPWARLARVPAVVASRRWTDSLPRKGLGLANRWASRAAHLVLANSEEVGRLAQLDGIGPSKIFVLPNFLDATAFEAWTDEERRTRREAVGVPGDALVVGSVARLVPEKGLDRLLEAFGRLDGGPDLRLVLVGEGPTRPALERQARDLGLAPRVHFVGTMSEAWNLHGLFDVSVLSSVSEGFPNSLIEAMAAARPIVATTVGGIPNAIRHEETGLLVPPGDVDAMSNALGRLVRDPRLRQRLGGSAARAARVEYHSEAVLARLTACYRSLLARGHPARESR